jgi:WD domain, G-beta repeat
MILGMRISALAVLVLLVTGPSRAEQQSGAPPVLRLETGMHTAPIRAAAVDAGGRLLATASFDKTVRLWSLATGEQLRVLRPAIGSGPEGELFAVAVSPDGQFVITGGWTGFEWEKANSLYVFETGTTGPADRRAPAGHRPTGLVAGRPLRPGWPRRRQRHLRVRDRRLA